MEEVLYINEKGDCPLFLHGQWRRPFMLRKSYPLIKLLSTVLIFISLISLASVCFCADKSVKVWEEPLAIPTYRIGEPDLNPIFYAGRAYQGAKGPVYPYPLLDRLTDIREMKTYKALYLENDYLKICVLPEIGGRIFSALDKTDDYDFFYHQHVIKPALVGMLGAWISGGVEWNFPHHHRASGYMNVDYTLSQNPDGSKTIWVGEIELRHRMKWIVDLTLYPDRSYLEATVKIFNRTPFAHSFLWWANVAVHANENYQIIFPPSTEFATFHGKNQFSHWPISHEIYNGVDYTQGVDVSWYKNHPSPTSFFAWNCEEDFLAGYDHGKEAGVVHVADHHLVPGKKFWTWGTGSQGKTWEKILTETDGPYIELMVGAFSDNQPDYSWLQPYEVRTFKQHWYPIRMIGGVKAANLDAACNLDVAGTKAKIGFNTTSERRGAKAILIEGERIIFEQTADISPDSPFSREIELPQGIKEENLRLLLLSYKGETLVSYAPPKKKGTSMPETVKPPPPPQDIKTVEELYSTGLRLEQFYNPAFEPYPYYEEALRRDPADSRVNTAIARLCLQRGMFEEAKQRLNLALSRLTKNYTSPKDGEPYYYLGVSLRAQGKNGKAYDAFYKATWSQAWAGAAYYSLAELACEKGDFSRALDFIDRSLSMNSLNTKAVNLKSALLRKLGRFEEAGKIDSQVLAFDPLDFWAGNELYLANSSLGKKEEALEEKQALKIKMRDSAQSYLELATDYSDCGLFDEASEILLRLIDSKKKWDSTYPLLYYYLGYFEGKRENEAEALKYYKLAAEMPPDYCFPFQLESMAVLRAAERLNPSDARAPYYLGNFLYDLQPEEAIKEWEKSRQLDESFPIVHRNLGLAYARVLNDVPKATASLEKALACNSRDPRLYYELDLLYEAGGISPEIRLGLLERNHDIVLQRDDSLSREILLLVQLGKYQKAIDLLSERHFHVWEGGGGLHNLYVDAHLWRGEERFAARRYKEALKDYQAALEYPENLEVARPNKGGRDSQIYYFIATAYEALGDAKKTGEFYEKSVEQKQGWSEICFYQGLAFRKLGKADEAEQTFNGLIQSGKQSLESAPSLDFFAKFGEKQSAFVRNAEAHYLIGLGYLGKGDKQEARAEFKKALELNINHSGAKRQLGK
jgi:tetratricopeptide (TPR) repeat protein